MKKTNNDGPTPETPETPETRLAEFYSGNSGNYFSFRSSRSGPFRSLKTDGKTRTKQQGKEQQKKAS